MKIYLVGGAVRDKLLGIKSNDLDYVMVLDDTTLSLEKGYKAMKKHLIDEGFKIFLETPKMVTIRAKFPKEHKNKGIADFVLARKELGYKEGTRRPILELGTLWDDLVRRDFTVNAMAEDEDGNIIDYFNGREHLNDKILVTPQPAFITLKEDSLRILRAIRFHITKGFMISFDIEQAMNNPDIISNIEKVVSQERIREELLKMMKFDTISTINVLTKYKLLSVCFGGDMWLMPTLKDK